MQITELQELLTRERSQNVSASVELKDCMERLESYKARIAELEMTNLSLDQRTAALATSIEEQSASFRAQVGTRLVTQLGLVTKLELGLVTKLGLGLSTAVTVTS